MPKRFRNSLLKPAPRARSNKIREPKPADGVFEHRQDLAFLTFGLLQFVPQVLSTVAETGTLLPFSVTAF
jgi:hypothetical protein